MLWRTKNDKYEVFMTIEITARTRAKTLTCQGNNAHWALVLGMGMGLCLIFTKLIILETNIKKSGQIMEKIR